MRGGAIEDSPFRHGIVVSPIAGASACIISCHLGRWLLLLYAVSLATVASRADNFRHSLQSAARC